MSCSIPHHHCWSAERLSGADLRGLLDSAVEVRQTKQRDGRWAPLRGRNLALVADAGDGAAAICKRAACELGGTVTLLDARDWQSSTGAHLDDAARMLGRLYEAIDCYGLSTARLGQIDASSGVPVFNGLASAEHPLSAVGALLTMCDVSGKPLDHQRLRLRGDPLSRPYRAVAALARLAAIDVQPHATAALGAAGETKNEPDFVFDGPAVPGANNRLIVPDANADAHARIAMLLDDNCQCVLQALLVCSLR